MKSTLKKVTVMSGSGLTVVLLLHLILISSQLTCNKQRADYSTTAEGTTALRAIFALDPDKKVRNPDYLAVKFVSKEFWESSRLRLNFNLMRWVFKEYKIIGILAHEVNGRTHHIDSLLKNEASKGIKQVVILGAGFDSRAHRFKKILPKIHFFEVDHPSTQKEKKRRVMKIFGSLPDNVTYVPIDFNKESLRDVLKKAGYNPSLKSYFIWEGVTMYISEDAIDDTLNFIAKNSAPGSSVVFNYTARQIVLGNEEKCPGAKELLKIFADKGEPWIFGVDWINAEKFVNQHGLKVLSNLSTNDMINRYLVRSDGSVDIKLRIKKSCTGGIMHAMVP